MRLSTLKVFGRVLAYAVLTAMVTLGFAFLLFQNPTAREATNQAYQEVHAHRVSQHCFNSAVAEALRAIAEQVGAPPQELEPVDTMGVDCSELQDSAP